MNKTPVPSEPHYNNPFAHVLESSLEGVHGGQEQGGAPLVNNVPGTNTAYDSGVGVPQSPHRSDLQVSTLLSVTI